MQFLLRIPGWLLWVLSFVLMLSVGGLFPVGLALAIGMEKCRSYETMMMWVYGFWIIAVLTMFITIDDFIIPRWGKKWCDEGLRYAKCAKDNGLTNLAEKAAKCFLKGSIFKDGYSIINLGLCYAEGFGVKKDIAKAASCYKMAAAQATYKISCIGKVALGFCYAEGLGVDKDKVKAEDWYKKANDALLEWSRHFPSCGLKFIVQYDKHDDRCWNKIEVIKWMRSAAELGHAAIQIQLSSCYENGWGVTKDDAEAGRWIRKAAETGDAEAQYELGRRYKSQNTAEAIKWFCMAADQGHQYAIEELGVLKKIGSQDLEERLS